MGNLLDEAVTGVDNRLKQGLVVVTQYPPVNSGVWASGILYVICSSTLRLRYFQSELGACDKQNYGGYCVSC